VVKKTVLLIDDEQSLIEPLADALEYEGYRVLKARSAQEALRILDCEHVDLVTIDIMLDPGQDFQDKVDSHSTGLFLCREIRNKYPQIDAFCISVISEMQTIKTIESLGIRFLRKGETPLRTVLNFLRASLTGIAYSSERERK
jgi:two-component system, NtrC family, nitrogen regulation response regulator NtrX